MRITIEIDGAPVAEAVAPQTGPGAPAATWVGPTAAGAIDGGPAPTAGSAAGIPPVAGISAVPGAAPAAPPVEAQTALNAQPAGQAPVGPRQDGES